MKKYIKFISVYSLFFFIIITNIIAQDSFYLPFYEDWQSGDFETNNWSVNTSKIEVWPYDGNPEPCVRLDIYNYYDEEPHQLTSNTFNASDIKVGRIYLKFDLKHGGSTPSTEQFFIIKAGDENLWNIIDTIPTTTDFHWTTYFYEITDFSINQNFKIQFENTGEKNSQSWYWNIDNIKVFHECDKPEELEGEVVYTEEKMGSMVKWKAPKSVYNFDGWKHWDTGNNYSAIGNDCGECEVNTAIRWDPEML